MQTEWNLSQLKGTLLSFAKERCEACESGATRQERDEVLTSPQQLPPAIKTCSTCPLHLPHRLHIHATHLTATMESAMLLQFGIAAIAVVIAEVAIMCGKRYVARRVSDVKTASTAAGGFDLPAREQLGLENFERRHLFQEATFEERLHASTGPQILQLAQRYVHAENVFAMFCHTDYSARYAWNRAAHKRLVTAVFLNLRYFDFLEDVDDKRNGKDQVWLGPLGQYLQYIDAFRESYYRLVMCEDDRALARDLEALGFDCKELQAWIDEQARQWEVIKAEARRTFEAKYGDYPGEEPVW
jgi:hypothetical protein